MSHLPRIAIGTVQEDADGQPLIWALMDVLERIGPHVQMFFSQARFVPFDAATAITGQSPRHLDSWLMSKEVCREVFYHGAASGELAIVEGQFGGSPQPIDASGGTLDTLCQWLDLPRIVILDASQFDGCRVPARPPQVDGVLLDRVPNGAQACRWRTNIEALWGVPVLGAMEEAASLRSLIARLPRGSQPSLELCRALGERLLPRLRLDRLLNIASQREFPEVTARLFQPEHDAAGLNIAVAYDEAFHCYFPDTLDLLELYGATIRDFSPLRGDGLPPDTDLIYLGCGHAENYAEQLAANHCMKQSLRSHVRRGGRIYAEGSGVAYLARYMVLDGKQQLPMVGVLPVVAALKPSPAPMQPVEITLTRDTWLGSAASRLRGYLNSNWQIDPMEPLASCAAPPHQGDLLATHQVIASRLHLNFAAQPELLHRLFQPNRTASFPAIHAAWT
jgi:cobyrinic acid a,c-diamide synthase